MNLVNPGNLVNPIGLVTTIVPVFNGARYLAETIDSVLSQTWPAIDVIVVDDGSTDDSAAVASRFGARVTLVGQARQGQAAALNHGLALAKGDLVAFLDADDVWNPTKTERQVARFAARADLGYCVTRIRSFLSPEYEHRRASLDPALFRDAPGYLVSSLMARRAVFDAIGGFDTTLRHANKTEWFLRARNRGIAFEEIDEVLVRRRLHAANRSQAFAARSIDEYLRLVKTSLDRRRRVSSP